LIFLTLGTHEQAFERALDLMVPLAETEEVVIQHGHTPPRPDSPGVEWIQFMSYDEIVEHMERASGIVCHAGVGTIITALRLARTPVVLPRLRHLDEHVDDHQLQITSELGRHGHVVACLDDDLPAALTEARSRRRVDLPGGRPLREAVRQASAQPR
jgi:UDP-N-acetylglucosamine transferase subunit ALG13